MMRVGVRTSIMIKMDARTKAMMIPTKKKAVTKVKKKPARDPCKHF